MKNALETLLLFFPFHVGRLIGNDIRPVPRIRKSTLQHLNPLFSESNATIWAMLRSHSARDSDTAIRHFDEGGSCYICSTAVKCGFGEMLQFGSSECFSNVLIKASPSLLSPPHFQG